MTFPDIHAELRTDESFKWGRESNDPCHTELFASPLLRSLSVNILTQFPLDYTHLVCLGVTRRPTTEQATADSLKTNYNYNYSVDGGRHGAIAWVSGVYRLDGV